ncbi:MAG: DUF4446 family protein [Candidatus Nomurabacteria bacterium]|nr:DUF4446 family protein [Candidatus Nomurabacteria bacterium]
MSFFPLDSFVVSVALFTLIGLVVILAVWVTLLQKKINNFMLGKDAASLEDTMQLLITEVERIHDAELSAHAHRDRMEHKLSQSIRGIGLTRFNPFTESTGQQSFALALVNANGDGTVVSTLYARERMSVFAKPIHKFASEFELSKEEAQALSQAKQSLQK